MSLHAKIFLFSAVTLAVFVVTAFFVVQHRVREAALFEAEEELLETARAIEELAADRAASRRLRAATLVRDERLENAVASEEPERLGALVSELASWLMTTDLVVITEETGEALYLSDPDGELSEIDFGTVEPLADALSTGEGQGIWIVGETIYETAALAIRTSGTGDTAGVLLIGVEVGDDIAETLYSLTRSHVLILADERPVGSSLPPARTGAILARFDELETDRSAVMSIGGEQLLVGLRSVPVDYGGLLCNHVIVEPLVGATRLARGIRTDLMVIGFAVLLFAFVADWWGARRIARPIHALAERMSEMTRSGELDDEFPATGAGGEVEQFETSFRSLVSSVLESQRARERSYVEAVGAVVAALDVRDQETSGHSFRVANYALLLARRAGVDGDELKAVEWGGLLHDIGKIGVPDAILRKPGKLTDEEWEIMKRHPTIGDGMLEGVAFLEPARAIVRHHHERWDGGGYPAGLRGEEIPLEARVFAVVDTYDAITSDRPYRAAQSHEAAVAELRRVAGAQLDPELVAHFVAFPRERLEHLRRAAADHGLGFRIEELDELMASLRASQRDAATGKPRGVTA